MALGGQHINATVLDCIVNNDGLKKVFSKNKDIIANATPYLEVTDVRFLIIYVMNYYP